MEVVNIFLYMKILISALQDGCSFPLINDGKEKLQQALLVSLFKNPTSSVRFFRYEFKLLDYFPNDERLSQIEIGMSSATESWHPEQRPCCVLITLFLEHDQISSRAKHADIIQP